MLIFMHRRKEKGIPGKENSECKGIRHWKVKDSSLWIWIYIEYKARSGQWPVGGVSGEVGEGQIMKAILLLWIRYLDLVL